jgi:D-sedoheptulose 7-phosphate isomerase
MSDSGQIAAGLRDLAALTTSVAARASELAPAVAAMRHCLRAGGTLFFCGNGGSAADAQHLATEYVVRYQPGNQPPLRALALTTDSSTLTAAANDFGFAQVFARQLRALARPGDVLIVHSTSGNSPNCVAAVTAARQIGVTSIALLGGDGGALRGLVDHGFVIEDARVNHVQELQLAVQHQIAALLTAEFRG